jgi:aspartate kinase
LVVQKFGGSSVANKDGIMNAAHRAIQAKRGGNQVIVVVSARGDTTDELIELAKEISDDPPAREMDMLLSTGEQVSCALLAMAIHKQGEQAISFTGNQVGIQTDSIHGKARIRKIDTKRLREALDTGHIVIVAGFQGIDQSGNITTLGRGGSDTTAVALAAVMKHDPAAPREVACDIYTDVEGIFTTDPRLVREARKLDMVSYDEMLELASVGANVLASRSIEFARKFAVPMQKRSSFSDKDGTWIVPEAEWMKTIDVCGAALQKDEARVAVIDVPNIPGVSHKIFSAIAEKNIAVDMIVQNNALSGQKATIGFTVPGGELRATLKAVEPVVAELNARVEFEDSVSKVSIVGTGMREHTGVAQKMFEALADAGITMKMITTGDIKISVLVDRKDGPTALSAVHQKFDLQEPRAGSGLPTATPTVHARPASVSPAKVESELLNQLLSSMEEIVVSNATLNYEHGLVYVFNLPDHPKNCARLFRAVADAGIIVDMIVQNPSDKDRSQISFSVPVNDLQRALSVTRKEATAIDSASSVEAGPHVARLIVSGVGMRSHTGVARKMFQALAATGINIAMINTSEVSINVVVDRAKGEEALQALKSAFNL